MRASARACLCARVLCVSVRRSTRWTRRSRLFSVSSLCSLTDLDESTGALASLCRLHTADLKPGVAQPAALRAAVAPHGWPPPSRRREALAHRLSAAGGGPAFRLHCRPLAALPLSGKDKFRRSAAAKQRPDPAGWMSVPIRPLHCGGSPGRTAWRRLSGKHGAIQLNSKVQETAGRRPALRSSYIQPGGCETRIRPELRPHQLETYYCSRR